MTHSRNARGFTIVELMVTVGIFAIITSVLLVRNSKFDDETLLQAAAYEVALSVRQAQNYGINVQGQGGYFDKPYGIYFETGAVSYVLFTDTDDDGYYNSQGGEELQTFTLGRGFQIAQVCITDGVCDAGVTSASIVFRRPEPEAIIMLSDGTTHPFLTVVLSSPRGGERYIVVRQTGQIAVTKAIEQATDGDPPPAPDQ